jgi:undecaprenyl diphosphate synthase
MDGNGRWATQRGMRRTKGHREGVEAAKRIVLEAIDMGVEHLTLYAFSTENWRRAQQEVSFLMALLATHLRDQYDFYRDNNVKVRHVGDIAGLPNEVRSEIDRTALETASNTAITVTLAVNYGGRDEIVRAVNRWIDSCNGDLGRHLCADELRAHLDHDDIPDPDLVIRTGGEQRISNFLLWECAYAELYFSQRLLPDWDAADLREAVDAFCARKRNFGGMR